MLRDKFLLLGQKLIESNPWFLAPLSFFYALAIFVRNQLYNLHILSAMKVPSVVVSVGNIVAGGTGKTPFVHLLAAAFGKRKVAILSRGVGSVPDEALLLAKKLPQVRVFVGKNRAKLAKKIAKDFDLIILDDGFQHRKLHRDVDVVLMHEKKEHYLPWGFLRDSPSRLKKADFIFRSGIDTHFQVARIVDLEGNEISSIQGKTLGIFCGIANPKRFKQTALKLGAKIAFETYFADHGAIDFSKLPKGLPLLCTEKDAVKLPKTNLPIWVLEMQLHVTQGQKLWEKLIEKIDEKIDNGRTYE